MDVHGQHMAWKDSAHQAWLGSGTAHADVNILLRGTEARGE